MKATQRYFLIVNHVFLSLFDELTDIYSAYIFWRDQQFAWAINTVIFVGFSYILALGNTVNLILEQDKDDRDFKIILNAIPFVNVVYRLKELRKPEPDLTVLNCGKTAEVVLESFPQCLLQLMIVVCLGYTRPSQLVSIASSFGSLIIWGFCRYGNGIEINAILKFLLFVSASAPVVPTFVLFLAYVRGFTAIAIISYFFPFFMIVFGKTSSDTEQSPCQGFKILPVLVFHLFSMINLGIIVVFDIDRPPDLASNPPLFHCYVPTTWNLTGSERTCAWNFTDETISNRCYDHLLPMVTDLEPRLRLVSVCSEDKRSNLFQMAAVFCCLGHVIAFASQITIWKLSRRKCRQKYIDNS